MSYNADAFREFERAYPAVDTHDALSVAKALSSLHETLFPTAQDERQRLEKSCEALYLLFNGTFPQFQAADTPYHDLEHSLQVVLCLARLLAGAILYGNQHLSSEAFERALISAFFHDIGYFKRKDDALGTGAKYTIHHEIRGTLMAADYLAQKSWPIERIQSVQRLILATGADRAIRAILFRDTEEAFLATCLCSADLLAQMSDPRYLDRLPLLFEEFAESDRFLEIPEDRRAIKSVEELFQQTPQFWQETLEKRLVLDCNAVYRHLETPYGSGQNPYLRAIEANLRMIEQK